MTDFLKISKSIVIHFAHICAYGVETVKSTLQKRGCKVYVISFLYSKCSTFKAAWVCSQSYGSISHNPTTCT